MASLTTLLKRSQIDDHEEVLQAADAALKQSKGDLNAQHAKVVALLRLDRFDDAIRLFDTAGDQLKDGARLEYAYALYKSGQPAEAAILAADGHGRGMKHVEAQARYRTEAFARTADLYDQLSANAENDSEADLRINSGAIDAQLEWAGQGEMARRKQPGRQDLEAFESAFNAACGSVARGELAQGEVLLKRARDLCNSLGDLNEEDKHAELVPIITQQIFVLVKQGKVEEAEKLAESLDTRAIRDSMTRKIAQVNALVASRNTSNPYLTQRLLAINTNGPTYSDPFRFQDIILKQNNHASDLQSLKLGGTISYTAALVTKEASPTLNPYMNSSSVANAAAHARMQTGKEALKLILPLLQHRPYDVGLVLTIVQLYVLTGNSGSAISFLESFLVQIEQQGSETQLDARYAPGLVGVMLSLYHAAGRRGHLKVECAKVAAYWRKKRTERSFGIIHILEITGSNLLESEEAEHQRLAKETFQELHELAPKDLYAAAGALAACRSEDATGKDASLTPIDSLVSGIKVDHLENAGIAQITSTARVSTTSRKRPTDTVQAPKAKRIRKSRIPKGFDPDKKPDPERWLPLRDRSTYRPKGKKGKARSNLLSQGAVPTADNVGGSRPNTPSSEVVKAKQQQGGAAGAKKKKAKGRR